MKFRTNLAKVLYVSLPENSAYFKVICVVQEGFMERKVNGRRKGAVSPRNERREEEEVFDYPGVEDESDGSGPVSRDAHNALRKGSY